MDDKRRKGHCLSGKDGFDYLLVVSTVRLNGLVFHVLYVDVMWCNVHKYLVDVLQILCLLNEWLLARTNNSFIFMMPFLIRFVCIRIYMNCFLFCWSFILTFYHFFISILNFSLEFMTWVFLASFLDCFFFF